MKKYLSLLFLLLSFAVSAQTRIAVTGKVVDSHNKNLEFATASIAGINYTAFTDTAGVFRLLIDPRLYPSLTINITMVGKQAVSRTINRNEYGIRQLFILEDLSLNLKEVNVSATRQRSTISNSSIFFDRQALDQIQAYSLADVLNNLPGKATTAPVLQYKQVVTLRSSATDNVQNDINSMGVAIYVDGMRQSNDANMQTLNMGIRGVHGGGVVNHSDPYTGNPNYDTSTSGLDIRNIPVDNIESIEVVSGVASAKYGELTDGAIIINRMAGKTDYLANIRLNGSSTNYSLSKGFNISPKAGAINLNFNYLNSIQDPTNNQKNYNRVSGGLMWSVYLNSRVKNTFSADYSYKMDNARPDPDDGSEASVFTKERHLSLSNRTSFQVDKPWLQRINIGLSYDLGYQETYRQLYVNGAVTGVANKDTTGIYEGFYIPGNYLALEHIIGKPYNGSANIDLFSAFKTGGISHDVSYGFSGYFSGNAGQGVVADASNPFPNTPGYATERPYNFDLLRDIFNFGFYAEDRLKFKLLNHQAIISAGARYDLQNSYPSFAPRINASYQLSKRWSLRGAFGIATKAPSMAYRYPGPTYFDIPLLNLYNGKVNESVYLVYTRKVEHDNSYLKPSRSTQFEAGLSGDYSFFTTSIYGYYKMGRDGFANTGAYSPVFLPIYTYTTSPGTKPVYQQTSNTKLYGTIKDNYVTNSVQSDNSGIELLINTRKIASIQTSFNISTSLSYTHYSNTGTTVAAAADSYIQQNATAWFGVYPASEMENLSIMSKISSDTHIPKLGFVVSIIADVFWKNTQRNLGKGIYPIAYLDKNGQYFPITNFDKTNKDYGYLALGLDNATYQQLPPFVYSTLSLRVAKEIRKKVRVSLFAYNVFDVRTRYYDPMLNNVTTYSNPVNVGGEIAFKF